MILIDIGSVTMTVSCFFPISRGYFSSTYLPATVVFQVCPGRIRVCCFYLHDLRFLFPRGKGPRRCFMPFPQQHPIPFSDPALLKKFFLVSCPSYSISSEHPMETHGKDLTLCMSVAPRSDCNDSPHSAFLSVSEIFS